MSVMQCEFSFPCNSFLSNTTFCFINNLLRSFLLLGHCFVTLIKLVTCTLISVVLWFVICCLYPNEEVDFLAPIIINWS